MAATAAHWLAWLVASAALLGAVDAQVSPPYYNDQKQNCNVMSASSFCYNGPQYLGTQVKSCKVPGTVALTFDDGPHPINTPIILDVLKQYGWKATFFMIGREVAKYPQIVQRVLDEGHQVGSHTQDHVLLSGVAPAVVTQQLRGWEASFKVAGLVGYDGALPGYFRARGGALDAVSAPIVADLGYTAVHWGYLTLDMQGATADQIPDIHASHFGANTQPAALGVIVQQHDIKPATTDSFASVAASLNATLAAHGARMVTVEQCLGDGAPPAMRNLKPAVLAVAPVAGGAPMPYYADQKQNCSLPAQAGSLCYGGPRIRDGQYRSCKVPGTVALTFDDGPHPVNTPIILDVLQLYGWKATFFMIGREMVKHPELVQRVLDEGHQVGSHTYSHAALARLNASAVAAELDAFEAAFLGAGLVASDAAGAEVPAYIRPPGGSLDDVAAGVLAGRGYTPIQYGYQMLEWQGAVAGQMMGIHASHLGAGTLPEQLTLIVQQHDIMNSTAAAFADVAAFLDTTLRGASMVTVAECLGGTDAYMAPGP